MKYLFLTLLLLLTGFILYLNIQLYPNQHTAQEQQADVILQLNFLEQELKQKELGQRMQEIFPEGYVFVNALYGLAWCELALADAQNQDLKQRALKEVLYAYNNLKTDAATGTFQTDLAPEYGIFYSGWKNYLLSKILTVDTAFSGSAAYIIDFRLQSHDIAKALRNAESPFLESYSGQAWPADMSVAMASLSNHDRVFPAKYQRDLTGWMNKVKKHADPATGLIVHKADARTGQPIEGPKGSSMGLLLRMLAEIDTVYGRQQFERFQPLFIETTVGLPSVREYPKGQSGSGDIDSGPVILGVGFTATIVQIGTLTMYRKKEWSNQQYKTVHAFGFDSTTESQKKYLFGKLPMADAFIAWGRATHLHYAKSATGAESTFWRLKFQLISLSIVLLSWLLYFRKALVNAKA